MGSEDSFLLLIYSFPSTSIFSISFTWKYRDVKLGKKIPYILPEPYIWKLKNLRDKDLSNLLSTTTVSIAVGEGSIRVVARDRVADLLSGFDKLRRKVEKLAREIVKFVNGQYPDHEFMNAYNDGGELDVLKWKSDRAKFERLLELVVRDKLGLPLEGLLTEREKEYVEAEVEELKDMIVEKAESLPRRFIYFVGEFNADLGALISTLSYRSRAEVLGEESGRLDALLRESREQVAEVVRENLRNKFAKLVYLLGERAKQVMAEVYQRENFASFSELGDLIREVVDSEDGLSAIDAMALLKDMYDNGGLDKRARRLLERLLKKLEKGIARMPKRLRKTLVDIEQLATIAGDEELLELVDRIKRADLDSVEDLRRRVEDPELRRLIEVNYVG